MTEHLAVLGLGEAGRIFATGLGRTLPVVGYDPAQVPDAPGITRVRSVSAAVRGARAILAFVPAAATRQLLQDASKAAKSHTVFVDFATASPDQKRELADLAAAAGLRFVDAAIFAPAGNGFTRTPVLFAGPDASSVANIWSAAGGVAEAISGPIGAAAARKLLRSILIKGLTALLIESLQTAEHEGLLDWFSDHAITSLTSLTPASIDAFLERTMLHSSRRIDEMTSAAEMADRAGGAPMTRATVEVLRRVQAGAIVPLSGGTR